MGSGNGLTNKEDVYEFENRLRDVIAELTKPIYEKIQDTLTNLRTMKGSQDEVSRQTKEIQFELTTMAQLGSKLDDIKNRVEENEKNVQTIYTSTQRKINSVQISFEGLQKDVKREEEYSRIARKSADSLQEEYCRIVHSVATEKQRNMMYIERAKREFVAEITVMKAKVEAIDGIRSEVKVLDEQHKKTETFLSENFEEKLLKQKLVFNRLLDEQAEKSGDDHKRLDQIAHQIDMHGREASRIERECQQTDFYLNKVQPIQNFTQLVTMLRNIIEDENQLVRIQELQDQFFYELKNHGELEQHLDEQKEEALLDINRPSPHYNRVLAAMKEVQTNKKGHKGGEKRQPQLLVDEEIDQFDALLKKVQNHREIVTNYEIKLDELGGLSESNSLSSTPEPITPAGPTVVYLQGKKSIIDPSDVMKFNQVPTAGQKHFESHRRSQSELQAITGVTVNGKNSPIKIKNPLALNLKDLATTGKPESKEQSLAGESQSQRSFHGNKSHRTWKVKQQSKMLSPTPHSAFVDLAAQTATAEVKHVDDLTSEDFKKMQKFDMTKEKYEATNIAMKTFERQFTVGGMSCNGVLALKRGLQVSNRRQMTMDRSKINTTSPDLLSASKQKASNLRQPNKILSKTTLRTTVNDGKSMQPEVTWNGDNFSGSGQGATKVENTGDKNALLTSFIVQQKKINEFHGTLVLNVLQDRQQQYEEEEGSESSSDGDVTSSLQDEMEAMDSVKLDADLDAGIKSANFGGAANSTNTDANKMQTGSAGGSKLISDQQTDSADKEQQSTVEKIGEASKSAVGSRARTRSIINSQATFSDANKSGTQGSKSKSMSKKSCLSKVRNAKIGGLQRHGSKLSNKVGKALGSVSGGMSSRGNRKFGDIIAKKDFDKKVKKIVEEVTEKLTPSQATIVHGMIQLKAESLEEQTDRKIEELTEKQQELNTQVESDIELVKELKIIVTDMSASFKKVIKSFNEQSERYDTCLTKMSRDKRGMIQMHDESLRKIEKNASLIYVMHKFTEQMAQRVNALLTAEDIDIHLYSQDDTDRQQTMLYGINEEAGSHDVKAKTTIQVNNHCMQCSGNASYIKKAFKIACLTYASSKVMYGSQEHTREELLNIRRGMVKSKPMLSIEQLNNEMQHEEQRLHLHLDIERPTTDFIGLLRNSYENPAKSGGGRGGVDSATSFQRGGGFDFHEVYNSTEKLSETTFIFKGNQNNQFRQAPDTALLKRSRFGLGVSDASLMEQGRTSLLAKDEAQLAAHLGRAQQATPTSPLLRQPVQTSPNDKDTTPTKVMMMKPVQSLKERVFSSENASTSLRQQQRPKQVPSPANKDTYALKEVKSVTQTASKRTLNSKDSNSDLPLSLRGQRRNGAATSKTTAAKNEIFKSPESSLSQTTRIMDGGHQRPIINGGRLSNHNILSGRIPETQKPLLATIETAGSRVRPLADTSRNDPMSKNLLPSNATVSGNGLRPTPQSGVSSISGGRTAKSHMRRRTIDSAGMSSTATPQKNRPV